MKSNRNAIEASAQGLLESLGIQSIPVALDRIAKALGARVFYAPLDEELSGMVYIKDETPIIAVNSLHHPNRQRFTLAHEIAHLHLHRELISQKVHVDKRFAESILKRDASSTTGSHWYEVEANQFAAALLMPRQHLERLLSASDLDVEDEQGLEEVARKFKVSKATLQYRIRNLADLSIRVGRRGKAILASD